MAREWLQPSPDFDHDLLMNHEIEHHSTSLPGSLWHASQSFLSSVSAFQGRLKEKFMSFKGCQRYSDHVLASKPSPLALIPVAPLVNETRSAPKPEEFETAEVDDFGDHEMTEDALIEDQPSSATSHLLDSTNTLPYLSAAETRSLHAPEDPVSTPSSTGSSSATPAPHFEFNHKALKIFGLSLILLSLLVWCLLRCKDPRWRAERAARHEEQRTRRLYKIAAGKYKIRTFFGGIRTKFLKLKIASSRVFMWDEKQTEMTNNEEDVRENHSETIEIVQRALSAIEAAEEGRNEFEYESESSQRRRSVSTLPGYESDGGQLPPYEAHRNFEISHPVNGMAFTVASDVDSNPDSSVVSTSPRFSRDGTNSDFDEKIEALSLDRNVKIDSFR